MKNPFRKKHLTPREVFIRTYLDSIAPGVVKFEVDHYIFGNTYRCVWALREYPASTESQAILRHLGEKSGVTLRLYCRQVSPGEEDRIIDNANKKNKLDGSDPNKLRQAVEAESNLRDVAELVHKMHREHEPLLHCAVYLEMTADSMEHLRQLQTDVLTELVRCKLNVDKLLLRQKQGFYCASPVGYNALGREFERVLPAGSVANLYPFNYSGKTDPNGFYIGKDKYGSNIVVDFDRRDSDKTSANILILGNSGQGKSYLMKLLICNLLEAGKSVVSLDAEHELEELCDKLGGCFIDLMAGEKRINVLEVRCWNEDTDMETDESAPEAFRKSTLLARHISFLKDFFRAYKDFSDPQLDTIEIMLSALYKKWGISEETDFRRLTPEDYPILSDLYALINNELVNYRNSSLYTRELLQEVLLGLHSLCVGADAPFFNGHTNISDDRFLVFGVGGVLTAAKSLRNALLFNVLAYMSDRLLTAGNTVAALDELYLWLSNPVAIEYIRNCLKRVRKRDSALMMASQNLEDFDQEGVREMTKPLFAIPPHQFLFNPGSIGKRFYMDMLQLDEAEFELIRRARRGECLFKCGAERYHLKVIAPDHKAVLFGTAGGK
jgi:type IV secretory pathway VirB4 component